MSRRRLPPVLMILAACGGRGSGPPAVRPGSIEPARLVATPAGCETTHQARVRLVADDGWRAGRADGWQAEADRLVAAANEVLPASACMTLVVVGHGAWDGRRTADLPGMLDELEALDAGDDVEWVIGLVEALPAPTDDLHQLAGARTLGKHLLVRRLDEADEAILVREALARHAAGPREALLARRGRHKTAVAFLHQVGHALGATHVTDEARLMAASYGPAQASFSPQATALFRAVIGARMGGDSAAFRAALKAYLEANRWDGWNVDELAVLEAELQKTVLDERDPASRLGAGVRADDKEQLRAAERLLAAGQPHEAWEILEKLIGLYPDERGLVPLACEAGLAADKSPADLASVCGRVDTTAPRLRERLAAITFLAGGAEGERARGRALIAGLHEATDGTPEEWARAARLARDAEMPSAAEDALKRAGAAGAEVAASVAALRARWALKRGAVEPAKEPAVLGQLRDALKLVYKSDFPAAQASLDALEREHRDLAGVQVVRCDLALRQKRFADARTQCERALARDPAAGWAHYLLALLDIRDKQPAAAVAHLEQAVALVPDVKDAWHKLAGLLRTAGSADRLALLRKAYQARFRAPLP